MTDTPAPPLMISVLVEQATDGVLAGFAEEVARRHDSEARRMVALVRALCVQAYKVGLRDGFVQGQEGADQAASDKLRAQEAETVEVVPAVVTEEMIERAVAVLNAHRDSIELDEDLAEAVLRAALEAGS